MLLNSSLIYLLGHSKWQLKEESLLLTYTLQSFLVHLEEQLRKLLASLMLLSLPLAI
jgi:hypothetical protein